MKYNIFENLKSVLSIGATDDKLRYYQAMSSNQKLEDDLQYQELEEGLVSYLSTLEKLSGSGFDKNNIEQTKKSLGISTIYEEKMFFTKLFMREYESKNNEKYKFRKDVKISNLYHNFASDELKEDLDFSKTIITLDGQYITGMTEQVRSDIDMMSIAIENDTSKEVLSFLSAKNEALTDSVLALKYFERIKDNNSYLSAYDTYENIFKQDEEGNFSDSLFKDNVQSEWLRDNDFLAGLAKLNVDFVNYIIDGKISLTSSDNIAVKKKV